jgi:hypothetical protein
MTTDNNFNLWGIIKFIIWVIIITMILSYWGLIK